MVRIFWKKCPRFSDMPNWMDQYSTKSIPKYLVIVDVYGGNIYYIH